MMSSPSIGVMTALACRPRTYSRLGRTGSPPVGVRVACGRTDEEPGLSDISASPPHGSGRPPVRPVPASGLYPIDQKTLDLIEIDRRIEELAKFKIKDYLK